MTGPVLVVTGAAGAGKSTVGAALRRDPRILSLDGDVMSEGPAGKATDYPAFWAYLLRVAAEVQRNGLTPAYACVCLPDQVLGNDTGAFTGVHFLALVSDAATVERRLRDRGDPRSLANLATHLRIDAELRGARVPGPHSITRLDTRGTGPDDTVRRALAWADGRLALVSADSDFARFPRLT